MKGYSVERSSNGQQFSAIGSQASGRRTYTYTDLSAFAADNYYCVKSIDANGKVAYTSVVKVSGVNQASSIAVYPNPVKDNNIRVEFSNQKPGTYKVTLRNPLGQTVYGGTVIVSGNSFVKQIQLDKNAAAGVYQLIIADDSKALYTEQISVE